MNHREREKPRDILIVVAGNTPEYIEWFRSQGYSGNPFIASRMHGIIFPHDPDQVRTVDRHRVEFVFTGTWWTNTHLVEVLCDRWPWIMFPCTDQPFTVGGVPGVVFRTGEGKE
jgi:hypothetical protein